MQTNDQTQQVNALLQTIGLAKPIYLMRTPSGKRLLQLPHSQKITTASGTGLQKNISPEKPLPDGIA